MNLARHCLCRVRDGQTEERFWWALRGGARASRVEVCGKKGDFMCVRASNMVVGEEEEEEEGMRTQRK